MRKRLSVPIAVPVAVLLCVGGLADYLTGPAIAAGAFYMSAVALSGWRGGKSLAVLTVLAAIVLDLTLDSFHPSRLPADPGAVNEALDAAIFLTVGWLAVLVGQQQRELAEQRQALEQANRQMEQEMADARDIQELLLGSLPQHPALDVGLFFEPARILGGDMADLSLSPEGRLAIVIADVSGKGSPAALAAAVLTGLLDEIPPRYVSPGETLAILNRRLTDRLPPFMFVTCFYGLLDLESGCLTYASAGHDPPLLFHDAGGASELEPTGMALGILPDSAYTEQTLAMRPGELLLCYTDGATDMRLPDGTRTGLPALQASAGTRLALSGPVLVRSVAADLLASAEDAPDDVTLVAVRLRSR